MGVTGLWQILGELAERKPIKYLSGKRIAVDLSGWVVQAMLCKGLNTAKNPHLKNLFFRVSRLLQEGAIPIFIMEGDLPAIKQDAFKKRNHQHSGKTNNSDNISRNSFNKVLNQCQQLLKCLGVPCMKSSGEAEAFCAFLCAKGVVEGVITEDNDAFLYGADAVYKEFSIDRTDSHINMYCLKSKKNKMHLDQTKLVALALLLGCDYCKGVPGVGRDAVVKLLNELNDCDLLQRFKEWTQKPESELFPGYEPNLKKQTHCSRCDHLGSQAKHKKAGCEICDNSTTCHPSSADNPCICPWHKNYQISQQRKAEIKIYNASKKVADFPDFKVIEEYLGFSDKIPLDAELQWNCPDIQQFLDKADTYWGWTPNYSFKKCFLILTSWYQYALSKNINTEKNCLQYRPTKIIKQTTLRGESCLHVQWASLSENDAEGSFESDENMCTVEFADRFCEAYPKITEEFFNSLKQKKSKSPIKKPKAGKENPEPKCKKMTEFYRVIRNPSTVECKDMGASPSDHILLKRCVEQKGSPDESAFKKQCL